MFSSFKFFKPERSSTVSQLAIEPPKRRKSLPPPASPRLATDAIVKRVATAYGQEQEEAFMEDMFRAAHDPGFLNIRAPLRESASMDWIRTMVRNEAGLRKSVSICLPVGEGNTEESVTKAIIRVFSPRKCKNNALVVVVVPPLHLEESAACSPDAPAPLPAYCPASHCDEPTQDPSYLLSPTLFNDCSETSRTLVDTPQITAEVHSHPAPAEDSVFDIDQLTPLDNLPSTASLSDSESIESCAEYLRPMMAAGANPSTLLQAEAKQACVASRVKVEYAKAQYSPAPAPVGPAPSLPLSMYDFTPVETLGSGAFGVVHRVDHKQTGVRCAVKVMYRPYRGQYTSDRAFAVAAGNWMMTAVKEQGAMKRVEGVEGVVQLLGSFYDSTAFYLVMPYYSGGSLRSVLDDCGALPLDIVTRYAAELVLGLECLHARGIIHRDLKPDNILIDADGHLQIADLGLAHGFKRGRCDTEKYAYDRGFLLEAGNEDREVTVGYCGSEFYIAPEVASDGEYSYTADIWSLGMVVFKMRFGHRMWNALEHDYDVLAAVNEEGVVFNPEECDKLGVSDDELWFMTCALALRAEDRPSATQLKAFPFFREISFATLRTDPVQAAWIPTPDDSIPRNPPTILTGAPIHPDQDFIPFFSYTSPALGQLPGQTVGDHSSRPTGREVEVVNPTSFSSNNSPALSPSADLMIVRDPTVPQASFDNHNSHVSSSQGFRAPRVPRPSEAWWAMPSAPSPPRPALRVMNPSSSFSSSSDSCAQRALTDHPIMSVPIVSPVSFDNPVSQLSSSSGSRVSSLILSGDASSSERRFLRSSRSSCSTSFVRSPSRGGLRVMNPSSSTSSSAPLADFSPIAHSALPNNHLLQPSTSGSSAFSSGPSERSSQLSSSSSSKGSHPLSNCLLFGATLSSGFPSTSSFTDSCSSLSRDSMEISSKSSLHTLSASQATPRKSLALTAPVVRQLKSLVGRAWDRCLSRLRS
ncbi:hypothetical protein EIP91_007210 [Steccherinum ochraceum]|uniref:non-specific serine/threonine protein kinase n=1 Tax=Steccherinum ochraceum TaxID=92696 RepID=A0A4R0R4J9_9APHY|nr:hypothetical protein EIP91_007210 [Steccherinum ochraceum]